MARRPWMPLYIADYLADTAHLNAAQSGAYLHLIMHYWQAGRLPENDDSLARIARMTSAQWSRNRDVLASFFHDGWKHKRIDGELEHQQEISEKRRDAVNQRHNKSSTNVDQKNTHARASSQSQSQSKNDLEDKSSKSPSRKRSVSDEPEGFKEFYEAFPKHVARRAAVKAYKSALKRAPAPEILEGAKRYAHEVYGKELQYVAHPATWLNADRWGDSTGPPANGNGLDAETRRIQDEAEKRSAEYNRKIEEAERELSPNQSTH